MQYTTNNFKETEQLGRMIASGMQGGEVMCLYGDLGAGKTTFVRGFIHFFIPEKRVLSPTFIIVRHYRIQHKVIKNIFHVDLYRMQNTGEIEDLGLKEYMYQSNSIVIIEWAERLNQKLPLPRTDLKFSVTADDKRKIILKTIHG